MWRHRQKHRDPQSHIGRGGSLCYGWGLLEDRCQGQAGDGAPGGRAFAPTTYVNDDGTTEDGWMVSTDSKLMFVAPDQIRVATTEELTDEEPA